MGAISLKLLVEGRRVNGKAKKTNITYEGIDFQIIKKTLQSWQRSELHSNLVAMEMQY